MLGAVQQVIAPGEPDSFQQSTLSRDQRGVPWVTHEEEEEEEEEGGGRGGGERGAAVFYIHGEQTQNLFSLSYFLATPPAEPELAGSANAHGLSVPQHPPWTWILPPGGGVVEAQGFDVTALRQRKPTPTARVKERAPTLRPPGEGAGGETSPLGCTCPTSRGS